MQAFNDPNPPFMKPKNPSFNRRASWHDYKSRCVYMITMLKAPDIPPFSTVINSSSSNVISAKAILSPTGKIIHEALQKLQDVNPYLSIIREVIMPDHIHFLIMVKAPLTKPLGAYLASFKGNCSQALQPADRNALQPTDKKHRESMFTEGFNDKILFRAGQLENFVKYIEDNPRRLLLRRMFPEYFTRVCHIKIDGISFSAYGNLNLLRSPDKQAVKVSSKYSAEELCRLRRLWTETARSGGVLVSPFISPKEKDVRDEGIEQGAKIIRICPNGFGERYKPSGEDFRLCEQGRMLQLAPLEVHTEKFMLERRQALIMNEWAARIAQMGAGEGMVIIRK